MGNTLIKVSSPLPENLRQNPTSRRWREFSDTCLSSWRDGADKASKGLTCRALLLGTAAKAVGGFCSCL